jgi:AAA domain
MSSNLHLVHSKNKKTIFINEQTINSFNLSDLPPRNFLIKRLRFEKGCLINVCGTGASGKTMFLQYLALCIQQNIPLFNSFHIEPGNHRVLHIDQEQSEALTKRRYQRLANGLNINSFTISRTKLEVKLDDPNFSRDEIEDILIKTFSNFDFILIDSLRQITCSDENSSQIADVLALLKTVAEKTNSVICFIHHKGKGNSNSKQTGRGSSAIYDNEDIQLDLDADQSTQTISVSCAKNRDGVFFDGFSYKISDTGFFIENQDCKSGLSLYLQEEKIRQKDHDKINIILAALKNGEKNQGELFNLIKGKRQLFNILIETMVKQNLIESKKGTGHSIIYYLGSNSNAINNDDGTE